MQGTINSRFGLVVVKQGPIQFQQSSIYGERVTSHQERNECIECFPDPPVACPQVGDSRGLTVALLPVVRCDADDPPSGLTGSGQGKTPVLVLFGHDAWDDLDSMDLQMFFPRMGPMKILP